MQSGAVAWILASDLATIGAGAWLCRLPQQTLGTIWSWTLLAAMGGEGIDAEASAELKERFSKSWGDKPTDQTISLAEVRTMFGLPPASVLELPDPEEHGRSLLHRAAHAGRPNLCKALLELGADPKLTDADGMTALMHTSGEGQEAAEAMNAHTALQGARQAGTAVGLLTVAGTTATPRG